MRTRIAAWLAWLLWALCLALAVLAMGLDFYTPPTKHDPNFRAWAGVPLLVYPTIGALVVSRRPKNAVGYILLGLGIVLEVQAFAAAYLNYARLTQSSPVLGPMIDYWVTAYTVGPIVVLGAALLVVLFPDGRLPASYFRGVVWMAVGGSALVSLWGFRWWYGETALDRLVWLLGLFGLTVLFISSVVSVFAILERLQSADARERQQIKWFGYGSVIFLSAVLFLLYTDAGYQVSEWLMFAVIVTGLLTLPVTIGVAILRHHLYDIDRIINRTLVYGLLTVLLAAGYIGTILVLERIGSFVFNVPIRALTGQQESQLATVAATLAMAALFNPLRRRIQSFIDRRFYRSKYDARKTLEALSAKLRDETDLDALSDDLVGVVRETMQPAHVSLWLRPDTASRAKQAD